MAGPIAGKQKFNVSRAGQVAIQTFNVRHRDREVSRRSGVLPAAPVPGSRFKNLLEIRVHGIPPEVPPAAGQASRGLLPAVHLEILIPVVLEDRVSAVVLVNEAAEGDNLSPAEQVVNTKDNNKKTPCWCGRGFFYSVLKT